MDEAQVEVGWWHGNETHPQPTYYSFTHPKPDKIEQSKIEPKEARWEKTLSTFILDYETIRQSADPEKELLAFFEFTYQAGARCAEWDPELITKGEPV